MSIETRRTVRDELIADLEEVTRAIVAEVRAEIPAYDSLQPAQLDEVAAIAGWGASRVLDAWVEDSALDESDLLRFRGIGAARALDGRPLPVVLRAYRVAGAAVTDLVAARAVERLEVTDALALARLWMASIDALSEALYAGHSATAERLGADRERALQDLLDDLLTGRHATPAAIADRTRELGVRLPARPVLVVAALPIGRDDAWWRRLVTGAGTERAEAPGDLLTRTHEGLGVALLPPEPHAVLARRLAAASEPVLAVALADHTVRELPRAFRLARHALESVPARALVGPLAGSHRLLDDADAAVLAVAAGHRDADPSALHRLVLGPLGENRALLEGLDAFLATGNAADAARTARCHAQTMRYRLRRIRELTGRDPRVPWDRLVLELALLGAPAGAGPHQPARRSPRHTVGP
ncbi:PucR family transcriptional regulator [Nocardioides campestrisoli]|uniref:PucR family transcriptional regulator n=1 Tax=Nocardioides campestrisoli TaxID=2736757 RepID=UPI0015E77042|nr:helix-turn-helix domain-containing protein [Nocardioides campestrisoli]